MLCVINLLIARIQNGEQVSLAEGADYFDMTLAEFSELWATTISPALAAAKQKRMNAADVKRAFDEFYALPNNRKYLGGPLFLRLWDDLQDRFQAGEEISAENCAGLLGIPLEVFRWIYATHLAHESKKMGDPPSMSRN